MKRQGPLAGIVLGLSYNTLYAQRKVQRSTGQNVAPVTMATKRIQTAPCSMWFGYSTGIMRSPWIFPLGPDNRFEPGMADRGQPTHFVPEWRKVRI